MTDTPTSILLFAAGLGTRMAPLTDTKPKPMVPVAGRPLFDHAFDHCGGLSVVANVHYHADQIETHVQDKSVKVSDERHALLDTGGGLKQALPLLDQSPVFTMNTDAVWAGPNPLDTLRTAWSPTHMDGLLLMIPRANATAHQGSGDFDILPDTTIRRGADYVYSGAQIIRTDLLANIDEDAFSMWRLWDQMLKAGRLCGVPYAGQWCDVGRPDSIPIAETMLDAAHV